MSVHIWPLGVGANGSFTLVMAAQAATAAGWLPPIGSHCSVHTLGAALAEAETLTVRVDAAACWWEDGAPPGASDVLPPEAESEDSEPQAANAISEAAAAAVQRSL